MPKNVLQKNFERVRRSCPGAGEGIVEVGIADLFINWCRKNSLWYLYYATACCGIELMQGGASKYDFDRFGAVFRTTPRQADMLMTCGTITHKMAEGSAADHAQMASQVGHRIGRAPITAALIQGFVRVVKARPDPAQGRCLRPRCPLAPRRHRKIRNLQQLSCKPKFASKA